MNQLLLFCCFALCHAQNKNIIKLAEELGATTLVGYVREAGLEGTLNGNGPFTVFAPTNDAFEAIPSAVKDKLAKDKSLLAQVLTFHVTSGAVMSNQLSNDMMVTSLDSGLHMRVNIYKKGDTSVVTVDGAKVTSADHMASNGVIHVIDRVMYPLPEKDIPTVLTEMSQFGTLLYAVSQGQLVGPLQGSGPFTVFAPNNDAFLKLPGNTFSDLLSNQTALVAVLKYHVVQATDYSAGLSTGSVPTMQGGSLSVTVNSDGVKVNNANVITADIPAENGVVHEIDTVLLPWK